MRCQPLRRLVEVDHPCVQSVHRCDCAEAAAREPALGWLLAVAAVAVGWLGYGWKGVVLAVTVVVFWLLLQFSRALRVMRAGRRRPVGTVPNAVMLHARLRPA
jgi:hypothetical protein